MKMRRPPVMHGHAGTDQGWAVISSMLAALALWGVIGWLLDQWWGTKFALPVGVIIGMALGIYAVVARVDHSQPGQTRPTDPDTGPPPARSRRETE